MQRSPSKAIDRLLMPPPAPVSPRGMIERRRRAAEIKASLEQKASGPRHHPQTSYFEDLRKKNEALCQQEARRKMKERIARRKAKRDAKRWLEQHTESKVASPSSIENGLEAAERAAIDGNDHFSEALADLLLEQAAQLEQQKEELKAVYKKPSLSALSITQTFSTPPSSNMPKPLSPPKPA